MTANDLTDLDNDRLLALFNGLRKRASDIDKDIATVRKEIKRRQRLETRLKQRLENDLGQTNDAPLGA